MGNVTLASVPTKTKLAEESQTLAQKYDAQVNWMRERGITGSLDGAPAPDRKPARPAPVSLMKPERSEK